MASATATHPRQTSNFGGCLAQRVFRRLHQLAPPIRYFFLHDLEAALLLNRVLHDGGYIFIERHPGTLGQFLERILHLWRNAEVQVPWSQNFFRFFIHLFGDTGLVAFLVESFDSGAANNIHYLAACNIKSNNSPQKFLKLTHYCLLFGKISDNVWRGCGEGVAQLPRNVIDNQVVLCHVRSTASNWRPVKIGLAPNTGGRKPQNTIK
jgi:hypothetical protein